MEPEGAPRPVRVMLVEDNGGVRRALAAVLNASGDLVVCAEVATVAEAGRVAEEAQPDVAIVDLRLPDGSGVEAGRSVRAARPGTRVLLLTSASEEEALVAAMLAGASGCLVKQLLGTDLVGSVRALAVDQTLVDLTAGAAALERAQSLAATLTGDETRLLGLLAEGRSNREIAEELGLSEDEVGGEVSAVLARLEAARRPRRTASSAGLPLQRCGAARPG